MMRDWQPRGLAGLLALDDAETIEGYRDGRHGEPEPGDNRSPSYRQGWRAGARDAGRIEYDAEDYALVTAWAAFLRSPEAGAWLRSKRAAAEPAGGNAG
jgi:hypothetical protein